MTRRYRLLWALALIGAAAPAAAQLTTYEARTQFAWQSPGAAPVGLLGYVNPAVLGRTPAAESVLAWTTGDDSRNWGLFSAVPHLGFGVVHRDRGPGSERDYRLGLGGGDADAAFGLAYGWSSGSGRDPVWVAGTVVQPSPLLSLGATWTTTRDGDARELAGDLGLRPFGTGRWTLFAEAARAGGEATGSYWSAGSDVRVLDGLHLTGRYVDGGGVRAGLRLELGSLGLSTQTRDDGTVHSVRLGPHRGSVLAPLRHRRPAYLRLDLNGPVRHRSYPLFDDSRPFLGLLADLHRAEEDQGLAGVAINLSGLQIDAAMAWELRQRLQGVRVAGKSVVVFLDRAGLRHYHLASVADQLVLDPMGTLDLRGFAAGQVYLRGALDRLGVGSQVWRYHEYKAALEPLYRTDMSAEDREQWQALVDDDYERARTAIRDARGVPPETFDRLVDGLGILQPQEALSHGLVDTLGRWQDLESLVDAPGGLVEADGLARPVDERWGAPPTVAVVYALGVCAMDSGIRARSLSADLRQLAEDDAVDAIVVRVDSPGGEALASDLVAGALATCRKSKPVIISQARLAASGGYWISMESDAIVTTPATVTGSIGVWSGWLYNRGLREKLSLSVDHVQAGAHADLGLGVPLPLLGISLPERPLNDAESARAHHVLEGVYDDFVARVAVARGRTPAQIDRVARGRVWSGTAAVEAGLADTLGGLETALGIARERAGLDPSRPLRVLELPQLAPFSLGGRGPLVRLLAPAAAPTEPLWLTRLRFRLDHNGQPLLMLPEPYLDELAPLRDRP